MLRGTSSTSTHSWEEGKIIRVRKCKTPRDVFLVSGVHVSVASLPFSYSSRGGSSLKLYILLIIISNYKKQTRSESPSECIRQTPNDGERFFAMHIIQSCLLWCYGVCRDSGRWSIDCIPRLDAAAPPPLPPLPSRARLRPHAPRGVRSRCRPSSSFSSSARCFALFFSFSFSSRRRIVLVKVIVGGFKSPSRR